MKKLLFVLFLFATSLAFAKDPVDTNSPKDLQSSSDATAVKKETAAENGVPVKR